MNAVLPNQQPTLINPDMTWIQKDTWLLSLLTHRHRQMGPASPFFRQGSNLGPLVQPIQSRACRTHWPLLPRFHILRVWMVSIIHEIWKVGSFSLRSTSSG